MSAMADQSAAIDEAISLLGENGYRVLRPFVGRARDYVEVADVPEASPHVGCGMMVDTETTGPDVSVDEIIQLAVTPFLFDRQTGAILHVHAAVVMYEEPSRPITEAASAVHGISPDRLVGQRFHADLVAELWTMAEVICAHNAAFDRPMLDRRFGATLPERAWGCTYVDVPWRRAKYPSASLGALLIEHTEHFFAGHDAADDCYAALHCLAMPFHTPGFDATEQYPFWHVLQRVQQRVVRLFATGAPFETKDALQRRGYKWNDPSKPGAQFKGWHRKAWWREVPEEALEEEYAWMTTAVYGGRPAALLSGREDVPATKRFAKGGAP
jgi:DNA polymerase-3 subunit epsilon